MKELTPKGTDCNHIAKMPVLLYSHERLCRRNSAQRSRIAFYPALTPVQCLHYCLTRPAVASVLIGVANTDQIPGGSRLRHGRPSRKRLQ